MIWRVSTSISPPWHWTFLKARYIYIYIKQRLCPESKQYDEQNTLAGRQWIADFFAEGKGRGFWTDGFIGWCGFGGSTKDSWQDICKGESQGLCHWTKHFPIGFGSVTCTVRASSFVKSFAGWKGQDVASASAGCESWACDIAGIKKSFAWFGVLFLSEYVPLDSLVFWQLRSGEEGMKMRALWIFGVFCTKENLCQLKTEESGEGEKNRTSKWSWSEWLFCNCFTETQRLAIFQDLCHWSQLRFEKTSMQRLLNASVCVLPQPYVQPLAWPWSEASLCIWARWYITSSGGTNWKNLHFRNVWDAKMH